jgi:hypothetical protein
MEEETLKRKKYSESRSNNRKGNKNQDMIKHMSKDMIKDMSEHMYEHIEQHMTPHMENENINENINVDKSISKDTKVIKHKYGLYNNVLLSDEDVTKLQAEFPNDWRVRIERLSEYIASTGKTYKSHLATIRSWDRQDKEKGKPPDRPRYGNFDPEEALEAAIRRSHGEA